MNSNSARIRTSLIPFYRPISLLDEMEELAGRFWTSWRPFSLDSALAPHTDTYEENGHLVMKTELPGIDKEDVDVTLDGDVLTIKAEKKEEVSEDARHHTRERYYGRYFRSTTLPFRVDADKVSASFENGVLELRLPKAEDVKTKKIEVKTQLPTGERKKRQKKSK